MKKLLSISFAFLIAFSVMHITIATHHCGSGNTTTEKVSINGELASCGMEVPDDKCSLLGKHFRRIVATTKSQFWLPGILMSNSGINKFYIMK